MPAGGYFGRALVCDVGDCAVVSAPLPLGDDVLRAYLGGVGLGTWLMHRLGPPGVDPLAPEVRLRPSGGPVTGHRSIRWPVWWPPGANRAVDRVRRERTLERRFLVRRLSEL